MCYVNSSEMCRNSAEVKSLNLPALEQVMTHFYGGSIVLSTRRRTVYGPFQTFLSVQCLERSWFVNPFILRLNGELLVPQDYSSWGGGGGGGGGQFHKGCQ